MVRFAHIADVHLGGWKQKPMQDLNFDSFKYAINVCLKEKLDFVLIAGDLFDSAYPPIEILKDTFAEFKRLKEANLPCYIIAGSHDYSVSGKTFLDVLEKAGFCKNVSRIEERDGKRYVNPVLEKGVALYGYPGRKAGLEVSEIRSLHLNDAPGLFRIFMLHTTIDKVKGSLPIDAVETDLLPKLEYYALGHIHIDFQYEQFVYPGPIYPNNFQELEDLGHGGFYIVDTNPKVSLKRIDIPTKNVVSIVLNVSDGQTATDTIISEIEKRNIENAVVLLRIKGSLSEGKISDINFQKIDEVAQKRGAYFLLKNTHDLTTIEPNISFDIKNSGEIEEQTIAQFLKDNPSEFNYNISQLLNVLSLEKQEDEKNEIFTNRLLDEAKKVFNW